MARKKYDPLWEIAGEKVALQGRELGFDAQCPHCNVTLQLGPRVKPGARVTCGLCGGASEIAIEEGAARLRSVPSV